MLNRLMQSTWTAGLALSVVLVAGVTDLHGQGRQGRGGDRGGFGGGSSMLSLVQRESVQAELQITEEQKVKLKDLSDAQRAAQRAQGFGGAGAFNQNQTAEERQAAMDQFRKAAEEQRKASEAKVKEILTPEQFQRASQLTLHAAGTGALQREDVITELKVTDEQKAEMAKIQAESMQKMFELGFGQENREAREKLQAEQKDKILAVLTPDQRKQWETKLGPPPADAPKTDAPKADVAKTDVPKSEPVKPVIRPAIEPDRPKDATVVADFGGGKVEDKPIEVKPGDVKPEAAKPGDAKPVEERRFSFNFRFAPWNEVLPKFAKEADLSLDMSVIPPGTFNYYDKKKYTAIEALDILNGYLLPKGFLLVYRDRFLVVLNIEDPIPPNLIPEVPLEDLPKFGKNTLLTVVITVNPEQLGAVETVKELLGPQGKLVAIAKTNSIVVTDIASNLMRINKLLSGAGAVIDPAKTGFKAFKLKHISALDAERLIRDQFGLPARGRTVAVAAPAAQPAQQQQQRSNDWRQQWQQQFQQFQPPQPAPQPAATVAAPATPANAGQKMQVSSVSQTNTLLVTANAADLALVEKIIASIDIGEDEDGKPFNKAANTPQFDVYPLQNVDIQVAINALNVILPGLQITEDPKGRRISVYATPDEHAQVKGLLKQLDDGSVPNGTLVSISLKKLDPAGAMTMLKNLFEKQADAPSIQADPQGRRLMVNGSAEQVSKIRTFLLSLGEDGLPLKDSDLTGGGSIRTIPLNGRNAQQIVAELEKMWPNQQSHPIRVVTPSAISPIRKIPAATLPQEQPEPEAQKPPVKATSDRPGTKGSNVSAKRDLPAKREKPVATARDNESLSADPCEEGDTPAADEPGADDPAGTEDPSAEKGPAEESKGPDASPKQEPSKAYVPKASTPKTQDGAKSGAAENSSEIIVSIVGNNLIISCNDLDKLNEFERMIMSLSQAASTQTRWTMFHLQAMDCTEAATLLGSLMPSSSVAKAEDSGSLVGQLTGGITALGSNLMDMTGMNNLSGTATLRIIPEPRSNSLLVSGTEDQINQITEFLKVLDAGELPDNLKDRIPRSIELQYANVLQVREIVEEVYKEQLTGGNPLAGGSGRNGQQAAINPLALLMGGAAGNQKNAGVKMTLGVDEQANTLIVSASDSLFKQVKMMVEAIDKSAHDAERTVQVISLKNSNSQIVQQALTSLVGKVKVSSTASAASNRQTTTNPFAAQMGQGFTPQFGQQPQANPVGGGNTGNTGGGDDAARAARAAARMQQFQQFQQGGGFPNFGGDNGGNRNRNR